MKEKLKEYLHMLSPRTVLSEQEETDWEEYDEREEYVSGAELESASGPRLTMTRGYVFLIIIVLVVIAIVAYNVMSRRHTYTSCKITDSYPAEDVAGTSYQKLGSGFVKYGSDGVTYVDGKGKTKWSTAYSIETPMTSVCEETMIIYEQQGYTVQILNRDGVIGSYQTDLPILRAETAKNGVAALILKDGEDASVRIVSTDGTALAEVRTTLEDQGYPIALDLSSDARNLIVSLAKVGAGTIDSSIVFYDFSSAAKSDDEHLTASITYRDEVFPMVYYAADSLPVAVSDKGFVTFTDSNHPEEKHSVRLDTEIISTFYDSDYIGFIMASDSPTERYRMQVYKYGGKKTADVLFNHGFTTVKMDSGEILLNDAGYLMAFLPNGIMRLSAGFEKRIGEFVKIPGFRKYAVLTNTGIDRIRIEG